VLPEPEALLTATPKVPGLDGRKMSKSYGNTIGCARIRIRSSRSSRRCKPIRRACAAPIPATRTCPVWDLHKIYSSAETQAWVQKGCRTAGIGCLECKAPLIEKSSRRSRHRKRAQEFEENPELVRGIIAQGCERAREAARDTWMSCAKPWP
jgi:tryptophanyl-tRNA synthetase